MPLSVRKPAGDPRLRRTSSYHQLVEWLMAADGMNVVNTGTGGEGFADVVRVPTGLQHGFRVGDIQVLCGKQLSALRRFPDDRFPAGNPDLNCPECLAASGSAH